MKCKSREDFSLSNQYEDVESLEDGGRREVEVENYGNYKSLRLPHELSSTTYNFEPQNNPFLGKRLWCTLRRVKKVSRMKLRNFRFCGWVNIFAVDEIIQMEERKSWAKWIEALCLFTWKNMIWNDQIIFLFFLRSSRKVFYLFFRLSVTK